MVLNKILIAIVISLTYTLYSQDRLIAEPDLAIKGEGWKIKEVSKRNYWQFLSFDLEKEMPAIKEADFYKNGGRFLRRTTSKGVTGNVPVSKQNAIIRAIAIREVRIRNSSGQNIAPQAEFKASSTEPESKLGVPEMMNDGDSWTTFIARGYRGDLKTRFQANNVLVKCQLKKPEEIQEIFIEHGAFKNAGLVKNIKLQSLQDGQWKDVVCHIKENSKREMKITFDSPLRTSAFRFACEGWPFRMKFNEEYLPDREHLKTHAFYLKSPIRANRGDIFSLQADNFDRKSFEKFLHDYKNTFWGFDIPEWDSNMKQLVRANSEISKYIPEEIKKYSNKDGGLRAFEKYFKIQKKLLYDDVVAHSGNISTAQYGPAFGARTTLLQTSGINQVLPVRSMLMALRGGSRQFGNIPWIHYQSCIWVDHPMRGSHYGKATCQLKREMFTSYYMGANGHQLEADMQAMFALDDKQNVILGPREENITDITDFRVSEIMTVGRNKIIGKLWYLDEFIYRPHKVFVHEIAIIEWQMIPGFKVVLFTSPAISSGVSMVIINEKQKGSIAFTTFPFFSFMESI